MGFWGLSDTTVPPVANFPDVDPTVALDTNFNGWLYMTADDIVEQWVKLNEVVPLNSDYDPSEYSSSLQCEAWQGPDAEIIRCFFPGGHSCPGFGNMPQMMWDFAKSHPNTDAPPVSYAQ
jgi:hypothetical protein